MKLFCAIYVVDDDEDVRESLCLVLGTYDLDTLSFRDGGSFAGSLDTLRPGVVLLDLAMPGDGIATLRRLQSYATHFRTIIITGDYDAPKAELAVSLGAARWFEKPYQTDDLVQAIGEECAIIGAAL